MSKIIDMIKKLGGKEENEEYVPKQVIDRRLDGLRRLRQVQVNEEEKVKLKKEIDDFNRERTARHLFGIKGKLEKKKSLISKIKNQKKVNILQNRQSLLEGNILDNKKEEFKKKEVNILSNSGSFIGRGNI